MREPISLEIDLSFEILITREETKGRVNLIRIYRPTNFVTSRLKEERKKAEIMCKNFPKGKREENNIFLRKSSLSTTENFQLRVSFSRSILRTWDPAYQTSSSLHSSRTKDSLSLSVPGRARYTGISLGRVFTAGWK